jgi:hypothetical protein
LLIIFISAGPAALQGQIRIMPMGNSITEGWDISGFNDNQKIAYRAELYNLLDAGGYSFDFVGHNQGGFPTVHDPDHAAISWITDAGILRLLQDGYDMVNDVETTGGLPYLDVYTPDIILLHIGTSDIVAGQGASVDTVAMILDEIDAWEVASGHDVIVFLARIVDQAVHNPTISDYNDNLDLMWAGRGDPGIIMVDMESGAGLIYPDDFKDNTHPNPDGDIKIGQAWYDAIDAYFSAIPEDPTGLTVTGKTATTVSLSWTDNSTTETGFIVERSFTSGSGFSQVASLGANTTSWTDNTGLAEGTLYYYRVMANAEPTPSGYSNEANTITLPTTPTGLSAVQQGSGSVGLTWNDLSFTETGYQVLRSTVPGGPYSTVATLSNNSTSHTDNLSLSEGTSYYYVVRATGAGGNSANSNEDGAITFPATPSGLTATPTGESTIGLSWSDNSQHETNYVVQRSLSSGGGYSTINTLPANTITYTDPGRTVGTNYYYRVYAIGAGGNSGFSNISGAATVPNAPTGLSATALGATSISLNWTDNSSQENGFRILRSTSSGSGYAQIATVSANIISYTNSTGLTEGTRYYYIVQATGPADPSGDSNEASAITWPAAPSGLAAIPASETSIGLHWTDNSSGETGYQVQRSLTPGTGFGIIATLGPGSTTFTDGGRSPGTPYYYRVRATGTGGNSLFSNEASATIGLDAPTGLTATSQGATVIGLNWTDNSDLESGYSIQRSLVSGSGYVQVGTVAANITTYSDNTGLAEGTAYYYRVQATGSGGDLAFSNEASAITWPTSPAGLTATPVDEATINLSWTDRSSKETGYQVERSETSGTGFTIIATLGVNSHTYSDPDRIPGTTYYYRVRATGTGGSSEYSNEASATTILIAPDGLTATVFDYNSIDLHWTDISTHESFYRVERSLTSGTGFTSIATLGKNTTDYTDNSCAEGTRYYYRVQAVRLGGDSPYSNEASATTVPATPTGLTATPASETTISLAWTDNSTHETSYVVQRATVSGGPYTTVTSLPANSISYTDLNRTVGTQYFYRVYAVGAGGNSEYSNVASATTQLLAPTGLTAAALDSVTIRLQWTDNSLAETRYNILRSLTQGSGHVSVGTTAANVTTYTNTGLTDGTRYYYLVRAETATAQSLPSNEASATTPVSAPTGLSALALDAQSIRLQWTDNSKSETNYVVERSLSGTSGFAQVALLGPNTTTYTNTGLDDNTAYYFRVKARGAYGDSHYSNVAAATTLLAVPDNPSNFRGTALNTCDVNLEWRDRSDNEEGFEIKRSLFPSTEFSVLKVLPPGTEAYADTSTRNNNTYYYRISAFNAAGHSDSSQISVNVAYVLNGGVIAANQTICPLGDPDPFTSSSGPSGGSNNWTYRWQSRISPDPFTNIPGATGLTYNPPAGILGTTQYVRVSTVECGSVSSNVLTVTAVDVEVPVFTSCPVNLEVKIERNLKYSLQTIPHPLFIDNCGVTLLTWSLSGDTVAHSPLTGINYLPPVRFPLGTTTVTYHAEDYSGNAAVCIFTVTVKIKDPEILNVSIPDAVMGIGDIVPVTISVSNDGSSVYALVSGTIGGYPLTGLQRINATTYLANFLIFEGGNSYLPAEDIPVANLVLTDGKTQSLPYNKPISQLHDHLDAMLPVITSMTAVPGLYKIGDAVVLNIVADGLNYVLDNASSINGIPVTRPNILFQEIGAGNYRLTYMVELGNHDVAAGELQASIILIKPSGNIGKPFSTIVNVDLVTIDAHPPVIQRMEVPNIDVGVGLKVQVTITADAEGYNVAPGTVINGVPISSPHVSFSEIAGGLYELSYVVQVGDNEVPDGGLHMTLVLRDSAGNMSLPYTKLEPNLLEIYTDLPSVFLSGTPEVCEGEGANLVLFLTGERKPWNVELYDGKDTTKYLNLGGTNFRLTVYPAQTTDYKVSKVTDVNGVRNTGNTFRVTVNPKTDVEILNLKSSYSVDDDPVQLTASHPGGTFSGPGVFSNGLFDPGLADTVNSPHTILYTYQNANGCISVDSALVFVLGANGDIFIPKPRVCDYSEPFDITASNVAGVNGSFALLNSLGQEVAGLIDHGDNTATIDPGMLPGDIYTVDYEYFDMVILYVRESFVVEAVKVPVIISPTQFTYCQSDGPVSLVADVAGAVFSGTGVSGNVNSGFFFNPAQGKVGNNVVTCTVSTSGGCTQSAEIVFTLLFAPQVRFTLSPTCVSPEGGVVAFSNLTPDKLKVDTWTWDFGDPASGAQNTSSLVEPTHFYEAPGARTISLTATTTEGCAGIQITDTIIGNAPAADFHWISDCYNPVRQTLFLDDSDPGSAAINYLRWTFRDSEGAVLDERVTTSPVDTVKYQFGGVDRYTVDLYVRNADGCAADTSNQVSLRPVIRLERASSYLEEFTDEPVSWTVDSDSTPISWTWDVPDFTGFNPVQGDRAWFTKFPVDQLVYLERSWVQSPCFDFSRTEAPMISLDIMRSFVPVQNGAVLQYRDNLEQDWKTVGQVGSGIGWYNSQNITNKPGGSSTGWALDVFNPDTEWVTARHELDALKGNPGVSFRIAIASTGAQGIGNQGFAFDNFRIGDRAKVVVMEHFTNSGSATARQADDRVDELASEYPFNMIDLQYHVNTPGFDPMNENNPYPPSTRTTVLGINEIPFTVLDGGITEDSRFSFTELQSPSVEDQLQLSMLETPVFDLDLEVDWSASEVAVTSTVTSNANFNDYVALYVVVFEREVTAYTGTNSDQVFRNVVLDMLPIQGKLLSNQWYPGKYQQVNNTWQVASYVEDFEDLGIAAFIQDRNSLRYLQAKVVYESGLVSTGGMKPELADLSVYPNPARDICYLNLGDRVEHDGMIELVDLSGQVILNMEIPARYQVIQMNLDQFYPGLYLIRWTEDGRLKGIGKVIKAR